MKFIFFQIEISNLAFEVLILGNCIRILGITTWFGVLVILTLNHSSDMMSNAAVLSRSPSREAVECMVMRNGLRIRRDTRNVSPGGA